LQARDHAETLFSRLYLEPDAHYSKCAGDYVVLVRVFKDAFLRHRLSDHNSGSSLHLSVESPHRRERGHAELSDRSEGRSSQKPRHQGFCYAGGTIAVVLALFTEPTWPIAGLVVMSVKKRRMNYG
jgi:hypothetical protein